MKRGVAAKHSRQPDGLNPDDPGIGMIARALADTPVSDIVLVCTGSVPGLEGAQRLILDVREQGENTVLWSDANALAGQMFAAAVWPRAHLGKDFAQQCLARAGLLVRDGGHVVCAVRKQKGAESLADFMGALFGEVRITGRQQGYRRLVSPVSSRFDRERAEEVLERTYSVRDEKLGSLDFIGAPGVFSRQHLDAGTKQLIEVVEAIEPPRRVLDLCAGIGPLGLWAACHWPQSQILAVESNVVAAALLRRNAACNGLDERVMVVEHDGLPERHRPSKRWIGTVDVALVNPPTHASVDELHALLSPLERWLRPGAPAFIVAARPKHILAALRSDRATVEVHPVEGYGVLEVRWPSEAV